MSNALTARRAALAGRAAPPEKNPPADKNERPLPSNPYTARATALDVAPPPAPTPAAPAAPLPPNSERPPLNRGAAMAALSSAASAAGGCKRADGPTGAGTATITFSPDGPVKSVSVSAPFAGTPVGQCVANAFRGAHVPPFSGSAFTLPKSFQIPQ